ncbi:MAG: prenyltransferase [Gammaproteobacteria bacterium]|nr:prenyltransferase [Gammaproteobacteria bacterium]MCK4833613.1 prenyltransferase [Gammaproteobacteria bacterium]
MRPPFLILTFACVFLGASTVVASQLAVNLPLLMLALLGALLAHISVNTLNEYFDFKSGLDFETIKTPFSGGSGALPQNPEMVGTVLTVAIASSITLLTIGIYFVWQYGAGIIPIGITGLVLIATYTGWVNRHPFVCLIAPGFGFGFLMVAGTQFVLLGEYITLSWLVAVIPFFLVNNLLLLNQFPDIKADTNAGRYHFPIAYGVKRSTMVYGLFVFATIATIVVGVLTGSFPTLSLIALLPMPLAFFALYGAIKLGEKIGGEPQYLGANVAVTILTTLLLGVSLVI